MCGILLWALPGLFLLFLRLALDFGGLFRRLPSVFSGVLFRFCDGERAVLRQVGGADQQDSCDKKGYAMERGDGGVSRLTRSAGKRGGVDLVAVSVQMPAPSAISRAG